MIWNWLYRKAFQEGAKEMREKIAKEFEKQERKQTAQMIRWTGLPTESGRSCGKGEK
jgi:hypothetical protein